MLKLDIRMRSMDMIRVNNKVYIWAGQESGTNCKNWVFRFKQHMRKYDLNSDNISNSTVQELEKRMADAFKAEWKTKVEPDQGVRPNQRNKLRTYRLFKNEYCTEPYVEEVLNRQYRSASWQSLDAELHHLK